ncbi:MAG: hypothetical protein ABII79_05715 [bacterium]
MYKRLTIYVVILPAITAVWFTLLYMPVRRQMAATSNEVTQAREQLQDFRKIMNQLPEFLEKRSRLSAERSALSSRLYAKDDVLLLFRRLHDQADRYHVGITEITPPVEELLYLNSIVPDSNQTQILSISLRLQGGYVNFGRFVGAIEQADFFQGVKECRILGTRDGIGELQLQFSFNALLGSFPEGV